MRCNRGATLWQSVPHVRGDEPSYCAPSRRCSHAFPTCVGMNRTSSGKVEKQKRVPHVRGDEPFCVVAHQTPEVAFPTCVGMNRWKSSAATTSRSVPHVRGDEPLMH